MRQLQYSVTFSHPDCQGDPHALASVVNVLSPDIVDRGDSCTNPFVCVGDDPVDPSTGNEYFSETDIPSVFPGISPSFTRYYNSLDAIGGANLGPENALFGGLGIGGWRHTYSRSLSFNPSSLPIEGRTKVRAIREDGHTFVFTFSSANNLGLYGTPESGAIATLYVKSDGTGYIYAEGNGNKEVYDTTGRLLSISDRNGNTQTITYAPAAPVNLADVPTSVVDNFGRTLSFSYQNYFLHSVTDGAGNVTTYDYDSNYRLSLVTFPDGSTRQYRYIDTDWPTGLTSVVDENGVTTFNVDYDVKGRAVLASIPGYPVQNHFVYGEGQTVVTDVLGISRSFHYSKPENHKLNTGVSSLPCKNCSYSKEIAYSPQGFPSYRTDYNLHKTTYLYQGPVGLVTSRTEADGTSEARTITTAWHATFRLPTQISEPGRTTSFTYDINGNQLTKTVVDTATSTARTWTFTYDTSGKVLTANGPRTDVQDITTYAYYNCTTGAECGQLHTVANALGHVTTFNSYDANGRPLTVTDPNGLVSTISYSPRGWVKTVTTGGELTSYDYWPTGLLKNVVRANGQRFDYTYDAAHRLTDVVDELGHRIHYTLDVMGNITTLEVFNQNNTRVQLRSRQYDSLNRLWKDIGANNQTTVYAYDDVGNLTSTTDPLNHTTTNAYDALNRLKQITDATTGITVYGYNARDDLVSVTDPRSLVTQYTVDAFDNITQLQSPDTGTTVNTYDAAGNLKTQRDAKNQTTSYSYDALNRMTQRTNQAGTVTSYSYDAGTYGKGHLTGMTDDVGGTSWTYDVHGRVAAKTVVFTGNPYSFVTSYTYDTAGRRLTQKLPSNKVIGYTWTSGRISALTLNGNPLVSNITYQPFQGPKSWTYANGQTPGYTFDLDGRVTSDPVHSVVSYDNDSRVTGQTLGNYSYLTGSQTFGYDLLDRLNAYTGVGGPHSYLYDANGNRTRATVGAATYLYGIDPSSNRVNTISTFPTLGYDANGSTTSFSSGSYGYDTLGRMNSVVRGANTTLSAYNGFDQRAKKTLNSYSKIFIYDDAGHRLGEYNYVGSSMIEEMVYLGDQPLASLRPAGTFYIHADYLNTPRQIDNSQGLAVWAWNSSPFGTEAANQNPRGVGGNFIFNDRFPGQYFDLESQISYNHHRTYIPFQGRYAESDPIGLEGGINTYAYVGGNPISFIDPDGLRVRPPPATARPQRHHSDPVFMGGNAIQPLTPYSRNMHEQLHRDLNTFLRHEQNNLGQHMRPQSNNSGSQIRQNFSRDQRLDALRRFYNQYQQSYPQAARDFFNQHPTLKHCN